MVINTRDESTLPHHLRNPFPFLSLFPPVAVSPRCGIRLRGVHPRAKNRFLFHGTLSTSTSTWRGEALARDELEGAAEADGADAALGEKVLDVAQVGAEEVERVRVVVLDGLRDVDDAEVAARWGGQLLLVLLLLFWRWGRGLV